jgi:hypothetical protein
MAAHVVVVEFIVRSLNIPSLIYQCNKKFNPLPTMIIVLLLCRQDGANGPPASDGYESPARPDSRPEVAV